MEERKTGKLYIVGTPIGNLRDITVRALEVLKSADLIACEDTRHTLGLLTHFGIRKPLVSYYKPKEKEGAERILASLRRGDTVALVTDAGMPCISDPGALLVGRAVNEGIEVSSAPGPTAVTTAMALSGICEPVFVFIGFLPPKKRDAIRVLERCARAEATIALYSSPHSVNDDLALIYEVLGARRVVTARELTKIYESVEERELPFTIESPKGEYVLLVRSEEKREDAPQGTLKEQAEALISAGVSKKDAVKRVARDNGVPKDEVYKLFIGREE